MDRLRIERHPGVWHSRGLEGAQDGNGDGAGTGTGTGTGVETRRRTPNGNGDGNRDGSEDSIEDRNGDEDNGNGNEDRIGEGGREAKKRKKPQNSCKRRAGNRGDTGGKRKQNVEKKGWFSSCQP